MLKIFNYILRLFGISLVALPAIPKAVIESTRMILLQTAEMEGSGEFRRAQAMRAIMNIHPDATQRQIALAIELAINGG